MDNTIRTIEGTVTLTDGTVSHFRIGTDYGWSQWGADQARLWRTVHAMESLVLGLQDAEVPVVSDNDPEEDAPED